MKLVNKLFRTISNKQNYPEAFNVRDFIYLDIERIRSYVSQIYGGLITERTTRFDRKTAFAGSVEGGIPLSINVKGGLDKYLLKSDAETKSLHDHIFNEFHQALISTNSLLEIKKDSSNIWNENIFTDGCFLIAKTALKITDYKYVSDMAEGFQGIMDMLFRITSSGTDTTAIQQAKNNKKELEKIPTKEIAGIIRQFYADMVKIEFFPFTNSAEKIFVANADRELFRYSPKAMLDLYGPTIDAGWTAVLQVNRGVHSNDQILSASLGNAIDNSIKQVIVALSGISKITQGITFPAVAVTPIAVFRDISLSK